MNDTPFSVGHSTAEQRWEKKTVNSKEYKLPNGKKAVFEYDINGVGKVTLECMDALMAMIADRPQGEWIDKGNWMGIECSRCKCHSRYVTPFFPQCGARMKGADDVEIQESEGEE
ncbi:MAG: hypothetical protein VZR08_02200 [Anaerovoracaceae bacterium]|nr:hypothetical protein [Anaerovoracaceae bacterium]